MLGPDDLVITGSTLGHPPLATLVEAAAAGGFAGLSLWPGTSYQPARASGASIGELRSMLDDHGVVVNDVDALFCWVGPGDPGEGARGGPTEAEFYEAAEALRARFLNVVLTSAGPISVDQGAEVFAGVCDRAAEHGLTPTLEFIPFMPVADAATAWRIVQRAERPASGLMVDTWHCFRGPTRDEDLREIPGQRVLGVQINDAPAEPMANPLQETLHHRLPPGEGDIDLVGFVRLLDEIGSPAPLTVEVFSDALVKQYSPSEISVRLGDAIRALRAQR